MKFSVNFSPPAEKTVYGYRRRSCGTVYWRTKGGSVAFFDPSCGLAGNAAMQYWDSYAAYPATYEPLYEPFTIAIGA